MILLLKIPARCTRMWSRSAKSESHLSSFDLSRHVSKPQSFFVSISIDPWLNYGLSCEDLFSLFDCGTELPAGSPEGLCPKCLLAAGLNLLAQPASAALSDAPTEASVPVTPFTGTKLRY